MSKILSTPLPRRRFHAAQEDFCLPRKDFAVPVEAAM